jgi:hypothetical protein
VQGYINDTTGETHFEGINATAAEQVGRLGVPWLMITIMMGAPWHMGT